MSDQVINTDVRREVEEKIIHLFLKSRLAIEDLLSSGFAIDFFEARHQTLVQSIYDEFLDGNRLLTIDSYRQYLIQHGITKELSAMMSVFAKCSVGVYTTIDDLGYLKNQLIDNYVARCASQLISEFVPEARKRGYYFASRNMIDGLNSAVSLVDFKKSVFTSIDETRQDYIEYVKTRKENPEIRVICNIPEIDDSMVVGFKPQHLTLFVGDISSHKSNLLINVALNVWESGHNVLFLPLEMNRFDLMDRIVSNRVNIRNDLLARPEKLSDEEIKKIEQGKSEKSKDGYSLWNTQHNAKFSILDPDERTSVISLQREIEKRAFVFQPKLVVIDYIANLKPDMRFVGRNDLDIGEILKNLRFLGKKYGFHILSAAQLGRSAIRELREDANAVPDSTAIRGSHEYSADADNIFVLRRVRNEPDKLKLYRLKARHGIAGDTKELYVEPEFCRINSTEKMNELAAHDLTNKDTGFINEDPNDIAQSNIEFAFSDLLNDDDLLGID